MADQAVDIQGVTHRYGDRPALQDVTLSVERGTLFGLLGPNGSGKTTLFRILSTLIKAQEGEVRIFGLHAASQPDEVRRNISVIFQQPALDDDLTVSENLRFHGASYGLHGVSLKQRMGVLLERFGLADRAKARVGTLSGGLQRRVDLVRGLLHAPRLLLLDEPTTGLDPGARRLFWQEMASLRRREGTTMIAATHLMEEADACDRVGIIDRGKVAAVGIPEALKQHLSGQTLWIEAISPHDFSDSVQARFGFDAQVVENVVQISHSEAHTLLASLYDSFGEQIKSATIRRPTLEDVFMVHTGHRLGEHTGSLENADAQHAPVR